MIPSIARITAAAVGPDVPRPRFTETLDAPFTTTTIVWVEDGDGAVGVGGFDADSFGGFDLSGLEQVRAAARPLIGMDGDDRAAVFDALRWGGVNPFPPGATGAIDVALWDLAARRAGEPLFRFLGGERDTMPAYASVPTLPDPDAYLELLEQVVAAGFTAAKLHASGDPTRDADLHRGVHERLPGLALIHDAEGVYDPRGALDVGRALDETGCRWFEAPLSDFDLAGYRELRAVISTPLVPAGDAVWELRQFHEALRDPPWDALRTEVAHLGGVTPALALSTLAADRGLDVEWVSYGMPLLQAANLHVMLAGGRTSYFEQAWPAEPWCYGVVEPLVATDGAIAAPRGAGLGIELDADAIARATLDAIEVT